MEKERNDQLEDKVEENARWAKENGVQALTMEDAKRIAEATIFGFDKQANVTARYPDEKESMQVCESVKRLRNEHPSWDEGLKHLRKLCDDANLSLEIDWGSSEESDSGGAASAAGIESLVDLCLFEMISVYFGETRRELLLECFRFLLEAGMYCDVQYLPNVTWGPNARHGKANQRLTREDVEEIVNMSAFPLISLPSRFCSRLVEGQLQYALMAALPRAAMHSTMLWKHPSMGAYEHKFDSRYSCFKVFMTHGPSLVQMLNDGILAFNNNTRIPRDSNGHPTTVQ